MDVMLLECTVEVAKEVGVFCYKQLRIALDSAPLEGSGRVEDTFNLIGHALELLVDCASQRICFSALKASILLGYCSEYTSLSGSLFAV